MSAVKGAATTMTFPPSAQPPLQPPGGPYPGDQDPYAAPGHPGGPVRSAPPGPGQPAGYGRHEYAEPDDLRRYPPGYDVPAPTPFEVALPDLRNRVVNALIEANVLHAQQAWRRRRRDPISPHALLYLYAEPPVGEPPTCGLRLASRPFLGGDERHLPMLLYQFTDRVLEHLKNGVDPRGPQLSNAVQDMSAHARYIGLAVSSLDTTTGTWEQSQQTAYSDMDIPGRCYAVLADGSRILVDRYARTEYGQVHIISTHTIRDHSGLAQRRWERDRAHLTDEHQKDATAGHTWAWLHHIHTTIAHLHP